MDLRTWTPVAIAGCGAVTAVGCGLGAVRAALHANTSGLRPSSRFDRSRFQSSFVGAVPRDPVEGESADDDPAWRLAAAAVEEAVAEAGPVIDDLEPDRIGLVLSTTKANLEALERFADRRPCSVLARRHLLADLLAADLAEARGLRGPVQNISVACASGLVALQQGAKLIQRGAADAVFVVGVDHLSAFVMAGFSALKAMDPAGCRPFDRNRCGLSPGEAGAAVVLVEGGRVSKAALRLRGWGTSNDAHHMTGPSRDGSGLSHAIEVALHAAGLRPEEIDYVNAHGTGTVYNDAMESQALRRAFGEACPPVSGAKGMLGHTLGAAGVIETILCVLAMEEQLLPGTPGLTVPEESAPASLLRQPRPATRLRHILKLNAGFGGINGALILSHD